MYGTRLVFEERYCAFIDILGFSSTVSELERSPNPQRLDRLLSCLNFMAEEQSESAYTTDLPIYNLEGSNLIERELGDPRITYISDCVIVSTERTPDGFKQICNKASKIFTEMLVDGYLCRGAISGGPLIHDNRIIMGSAYMNAYKLEGRAIDPKVVIDKNLSEIEDSYPSVFPNCPPTIERGKDGSLYLRMFPFQYFPPYCYNWTTYLLRIRQHVSNGLTSQDERVQKKYDFARSEFNFALSEYGSFLEGELRPL